ncbi:hypothetical protein HOY82DRAFT_212756 [Tuber indicum]|nr:hypothetical protein HOY82DRAFT_212756 [Tuber indicum]
MWLLTVPLLSFLRFYEQNQALPGVADRVRSFGLSKALRFQSPARASYKYGHETESILLGVALPLGLRCRYDTTM